MATRTEFSWQDPFFLDQQLTSEERMIRDAARDYCQDGLATRVLKANREEVFDREIMNEFGALGLLGATIPEKYGCAGVNTISQSVEPRTVSPWLESNVTPTNVPGVVLKNFFSGHTLSVNLTGIF